MDNWCSRYEIAYRLMQSREYPSATKDFGFVTTKYPDVRKANGLTLAICNFLNWSGHRATRINTQGQMMTEKYRGRVINYGFRPTTTRKGTADISATIKVNGIGRSVMWEVKIGSDKPSVQQLEEQKREISAGGYYFFVKSIDEFFDQFDSLFVNSQ